MLEISQLTYRYPAGEDSESMSMCFDLLVQRGQILSLIGPSGSGKSTLLNLIAGFIIADSGSIMIDNQEIQNLEPAARPLSMVFQSHNLFPHLDVWTNIALGIKASLKLGREQKATIEDAMQRLGLNGMHKRKPGQLSGGQQQRVAIARALVRQHPVLLLDEPFAALGPALREEMLDIVKQLVDAKKMAAILVSHHPADARRVSAQTAFVHEGHIIKIAPTAELLANTEHDEIRHYLGAV
jgi:thiamine transport system ATP-binding protein